MHHIYYLKCDRRDDPTTANILHRLSVQNNLSVLTTTRNTASVQIWNNQSIFPHPEDIYGDGTLKDDELRVNKYDLSIRDSHYYSKNIENYMHSDTKIIATIRHPFQRVEFAFHYDNIAADAGILNQNVADPFEYFLQHIMEYPLEVTRSQMAFFAGMNLQEAAKSKPYMLHYLEFINDIFGVVIITEPEFYDEGLILLKRYFRWELKDIIYIPNKSQLNYTGKLDKVSDSENSQFWNFQSKLFIDIFMYKFFVKIHKENVIKEGDSFNHELYIFRVINERVGKFCKQIKTEVLQIESTDFSTAFKVTKPDCKMMITTPSHMEYILSFRQYQQLCELNFDSLELVNRQLFDFCSKYRSYFQQVFPYMQNK